MHIWHSLISIMLIYCYKLIVSVRHSLGRVLIEAGQYAEAEKVYREDLKKHKENGFV